MSVALTPHDRDLAALAVAARRDDFALDRLMTLAELGVGIEITVIAGGKVIHGVIATSEMYAAHFDEIMDKGLGDAAKRQPQLSDVEKDYAQAVRKGLKEAPAVREFEQSREADEKYNEELAAATADKPDGWDYRDLDEELARKLIAKVGPRMTLTLKDATVITTVPMFPAEVGWVRVSVANIAAWWIRADVKPADDSAAS